jgi:enoyl-CoA hydratase/carnithine racemase
VAIRSSTEKAFCAGGDIRFFHTAATQPPRGGSARLEDFFTEEYALNHLIHHFPKPYIALMDGIVMGGGMGVSQAGEAQRLRIVTERTRMAMPEVNIGLFPDVGGSYFLARTRHRIGLYLALTGEAIGATDALAGGLADLFVPSAQMPVLLQLLDTTHTADVAAAVRSFAASFAAEAAREPGPLLAHAAAIEDHFGHRSVAAIMQSLARDDSEFATRTLAAMRKRSPLMLCVTLEQLRRGTTLSVADCLRMERNMVRHCFEQEEVIEGIRAVVIDKDNAPRWSPATLDEVTPEMVERFFDPVWPDHAHPLRAL